MGKQKVEMSRISWDAKFFTSIANGTGFVMTDPAEVEIDDMRKKALHGPQSPLYGTTFSDENAFAERWRCECGDFTGSVFKGEICPNCKKPVTFRDTDPYTCGWIPLGQNKIISPLYYRLLQLNIGKDEFQEIVYMKKKVDRDGNRVDLTDEEKEEYQPKSPFYGIGLEEFRYRFDEIMDYYIQKRAHKADSLRKIKDEVLNVFTSHIPVYTTLLRQQSVTSENFYYTGIDKHINSTINLAKNLDDAEDIETPVILSRIQTRVNAMWEFNFDLITSKDGLIRDQLMGGSLNFTARNVIILDPTLKVNEIDLGYSCFYVMFKLKIIHYLQKMYDISLAAANSMWEAGYDFDPRIYKVMNLIIEREHPKVVINRNPTLNDLVSLNLFNCGELLLYLYYQIMIVIYIMAMGNSKGMVTK